jgi:hypothetical protein
MVLITSLISHNDILERFSRVLFVAPRCVCYIQSQSICGITLSFFDEGFR